MSGKGKKFPLPLSSIIDQRVRNPYPTSISSAKVETPQTATRNAATNAVGLYPMQEPWKAKSQLNCLPKDMRKAGIPESMRTTSPLVSDAVRLAMVSRVATKGVKDAMVLAALEKVPRHRFMESALESQAYIDASLPIGHHQTISQPYIVARMIEAMRNGRILEKVLEIGTGCGYQAAVLARIAKQVYSIERIKPLHELAKNNLRPMRIANIRLHYGDGMLGLPQAAPFDGIILAAAGLEVPHILLEQMTIGGRLIAPVGARQQMLQLIERVGQFEWVHVELEDCHFVPLRSGTV